jgi:DNA-binding response OmpR family regulator
MPFIKKPPAKAWEGSGLMPLGNLPRLPKERVAVLSVSPLLEDHAALHEIFAHSQWDLHRTQWELHRAATCKEAEEILRTVAAPVVLCESRLPDGSWQDILRRAERMVFPPPVVVTSRLADDRLWGEVLNLGGYDVLAKPFDKTEVLRVVVLAWWHWPQKANGRARAVNYHS